MKFFPFLFLFFTSLFSHQSGLSYLEMTQIDKTHVSVIYKKPLGDLQTQDLIVKYPSLCYISTEVKGLNIINGFIIKKYTLECTQKGLIGRRIWIEGLVRSDRGLIAIYKNNDFQQQALFKSSTPFMLITQHYSKFTLFSDYVKLGIVHILKGYDHLMFVLLLLLLSSSIKALLLAITAFTISHSLTLAFSIFKVINISIPYVEAMIALSIIFLARELLLYNKESLTRKYLSSVAFIFGLLHGLGFSSVLNNIGLPKGEIPLALFSFNVGIELGQLLFVILVFGILKMIEKYIGEFKAKILKVTVYSVGIYASFLFFQRTLSCYI